MGWEHILLVTKGDPQKEPVASSAHSSPQEAFEVSLSYDGWIVRQPLIGHLDSASDRLAGIRVA